MRDDKITPAWIAERFTAHEINSAIDCAARDAALAKSETDKRLFVQHTIPTLMAALALKVQGELITRRN